MLRFLEFISKHRMKQITDFFQNTFGLSPLTQSKILISAVILFGLWLIRLIILKFVWRQTEDVKKRYAWKSAISYTFPFVGLFLIISVWVHAFGSESGAFLGLLTAGLAIALKDPLTNIAGWLFILVRKPFSVGDRIQIGDHAGDVIDIRLFQFTILEIGNWVNADQSTGRIIHIPNGKVFIDSQANYSIGFQFIWHEIPVNITFESDWEKAKEILYNIVNKEALHFSKEAEGQIKEASKQYLIFYKHLTPAVYSSVTENGVLLTIRFLCDPRKRRTNEHTMWEHVLKEFGKYETIQFAYPTQRFYTTTGGQNTDSTIQSVFKPFH
jgi:small-conductance mechanosensitive channel